MVTGTANTGLYSLSRFKKSRVMGTKIANSEQVTCSSYSLFVIRHLKNAKYLSVFGILKSQILNRINGLSKSNLARPYIDALKSQLHKKSIHLSKYCTVGQLYKDSSHDATFLAIRWLLLDILKRYILVYLFIINFSDLGTEILNTNSCQYQSDANLRSMPLSRIQAPVFCSSHFEMQKNRREP